MSVVHPSIFLVIKRFPDRKGPILKLYQTNTSFQGMCEDYQACTDALTRWNKMESSEAVVRRKEYGGLIQSLESEIKTFLSKYCG